MEITGAAVAKVWGVVNRHFESLLTATDRIDTKHKAETNISYHVKELRELIAKCTSRLHAIEDYIGELEHQNKTSAPSGRDSCLNVSTDLTGDWYFLYLASGAVFGYMKIIPETISVTNTDPTRGSIPAKRAEFTIPMSVLNEIEDVDNVVRPDQDHLSCPCCRLSFCAAEFWKHALFEIASRGNKVPAWQVLDRTERPVWIVDEKAGWSNPIYRPRDSCGLREIKQSLEDLNLKHFVSDQEFSRVLDITFDFIVKELSG